MLTAKFFHSPLLLIHSRSIFLLLFPLLHFMLTALLWVLIIFCLRVPISGTFFQASQHLFSTSPIHFFFFTLLVVEQTFSKSSDPSVASQLNVNGSKSQGAKTQKRRKPERSQLGLPSRRRGEQARVSPEIRKGCALSKRRWKNRSDFTKMKMQA